MLSGNYSPLLGVVPALGILTAVTVLEQVGHGTLTAVMNATYFGTVLAVGWVVMDSTGNIEDLYRTMMIGAVSGLIVGLPTTCAIARHPRALRREPSKPRPLSPSARHLEEHVMERNVIATERDRMGEIARMAADIFSVSAQQVATAESFVNDLETDSLLAIELLTRLEKCYDIHIPDSEVLQMVNLRDTYEVVAQCAGW